MNRLERIAHFVKGETVADIGTDHAYLLIDLAKQGKIKIGYACDVNVEPLKNAEKNIANNNVESVVKTLLSNGLEKLNDSVDEIIIAGLGQNTISAILDVDKSKLSNRIIVCCNTLSNEIRSVMKKKKYKIEYEEIIIDNKKFYELIIFNINEGLEITELYLGDYLSKNINENTKEYYDFILKKFEVITKHRKEEKILTEIKKIKELI